MPWKLIAVILCLTLVSGCEQKDKVTTEAVVTETSQTPRDQIDMQKVMAEMMEKAAPGDPHKHLARLVGSWDLTVQMRMSPEAPWQSEKMTCTYRSVLGGRYVVEEMKGSFGGMPMEGMQILGYDNLTGKYTAVWRDTMSTWPISSTGTVDSTGQVITYKGQMKDVITPNGRPFRSIFRHVDENNIHIEMFDTIDDKDVKVMDIKGVRK